MSDAFDVKKQLAFYGSYHRNPVNIGIHIVFVPLILWSSMVVLSQIHLPIPFVPPGYTPLAKHLAFEPSLPLVLAIIYQLYYFSLQPLGALIYLPQMTLMYLTSTAFAHENPHSIRIALAIFFFSWAAQFAGHGIFEGRQPALFDSVIQAFVLAPFFVHLEMLFPFGFKPQLHKDVNNLSAVELARVRKLEGEKMRAKAL